MNDNGIARDPPPSYDEAITFKAQERNGVPTGIRRSIEDEGRALPDGWVRQFDPKYGHQFYVDTRSEPYRSIWHHPFDDDEYMSSIAVEERDRIQSAHRVRSQADVEAESTDDDDMTNEQGATDSRTASNSNGQKPRLGRKLKDKLLNSTHEEREARRAVRAEEERRLLEQHRAIRIAMIRAMETGKPQLLGKDANGHDVYVEPPRGPGMGQNYGYPGASFDRFGSTSRIYQDPNVRFVRPSAPYSRPYGSGYGGGFGLPLAGGLAGGLLLGGVLGAGF